MDDNSENSGTSTPMSKSKQKRKWHFKGKSTRTRKEKKIKTAKVKNDEDELERTYEPKLVQTNTNKEDLVKRNTELTNLYEEAKTEVVHLRDSLLNKIENKDTQIRDLLDKVESQKMELTQYQKQHISMNAEIRKLRQNVQTMQDRLNSVEQNLSLCKTANCQLTTEIVKLQEAKSKLEVEIAKKSMATMECLSGSVQQEKGVLLTRPVGSSKRSAASMPVTIPNVPSSKVSEKRLVSRAEELHKVLSAISSRSAPDDEDLIATLAEFFRRYPKIALEAVKMASLQFFNELQELTPSQTLDLKLLLRLPMQKFRDLRSFLVNHGIRVLASEKQMYSEFKVRRNFKQSLEVQPCQMKKKACDVEESNVVIARVTDIIPYLQEVIEVHEHKGNTWEDGQFQDKIWVKIGGDKGGSSTKLAAQIVQIQKPNSATNTEILALYEAADTYQNMKRGFDIYTAQCCDLQKSWYWLGVLNGEVSRYMVQTATLIICHCTNQVYLEEQKENGVLHI